jgi:hypothetical protein
MTIVGGFCRYAVGKTFAAANESYIEISALNLGGLDRHRQA